MKRSFEHLVSLFHALGPVEAKGRILKPSPLLSLQGSFESALRDFGKLGTLRLNSQKSAPAKGLNFTPTRHCQLSGLYHHLPEHLLDPFRLG